MRSLPSSREGTGFWIRLAGLAVLDALAVWAIPTLVDTDNWLSLVILLVGVVGINAIYLSSRTIPLRYLAPGLVLLAVFFVYPIGYTVYLSLTNFAQTNNVNKEQAIRALQKITVISDDPEEFQLTIYRNPDGALKFLTVDEDGEVCYGVPRPQEDGFVPAQPACEAVDVDPAAPPDTIEDFARLRLIDLIQAEGNITGLVLDTKQGEAVAVTATSALAGQVQRYRYDAALDSLIDRIADRTCPAGEANFICDDGAVLTPGWRTFVGTRNYGRALTERRLAAPLLRVFTWNVTYAAAVVALQLAIGLGLALALHNTAMRGKKLYRSLLILPYAIPGFISVLIWRGLLDADFGPVNRLLESLGTFSVLGIDRIPWLLDGLMAKISVILVTVWQGFPYMMLIAMGALQSIPNDLIEAAKVDGANSWKIFWKVTFPMLMVIIAPLLIASFAFNFNSFINIFLLTSGGPAILSYDVPLGETDLLITFTYTLSQNSGRFALSATFSILIFFIVATIAAFSFRYTKRLERIYGNL